MIVIELGMGIEMNEKYVRFSSGYMNRIWYYGHGKYGLRKIYII